MVCMCVCMCMCVFVCVCICVCAFTYGHYCRGKEKHMCMLSIEHRTHYCLFFLQTHNIIETHRLSRGVVSVPVYGWIGRRSLWCSQTPNQQQERQSSGSKRMAQGCQWLVQSRWSSTTRAWVELIVETSCSATTAAGWRKFYKYVFFFTLDVAITNAYILQKCFCPSVPHKTIKDFQLHLAKQLIGNYCSSQRLERKPLAIRSLPLAALQ